MATCNVPGVLTGTVGQVRRLVSAMEYGRQDNGSQMELRRYKQVLIAI